MIVCTRVCTQNMTFKEHALEFRFAFSSLYASIPLVSDGLLIVFWFALSPIYVDAEEKFKRESINVLMNTR